MSIKDRLRSVKIAQALRELQEADAGFQAELVSGTNIKTINGNSILGSGNLVVGGGGYSEGTSFPGSPTSGDKFYRTDLNWLCFYDGTRWLTCHEYADSLGEDVTVLSTTNTVARIAVRQDYFPYYTKATIATRIVGATNDGSNYWTITVSRVDTASALTTIASVTTSAQSPNSSASQTVTINSAATSSWVYLESTGTKTGSPSNSLPMVNVYYRLIVT